MPRAISVARVGTFSVAVRDHGKTVGTFTCRLRVTQYRGGFKVMATPEGGWLKVPSSGRWDAWLAIRGRGLAGEDPMRLPPSFYTQPPGRVSFRPGEILGYGFSASMPSRIACGVIAVERGRSRADVYRKLYPTVSWPSFKLLGANVPVDPSQPDGGLG